MVFSGQLSMPLGWGAEAEESAEGGDWWSQVSEEQEDTDSRTYVP